MALRWEAGLHADGTVVPSDKRFSHGRTMGMRNATGRFLKPYADLLKHLASLISFTTDKTLTVPFSWFRHRRRLLRCGVEDEGT